MKKILSFWLMLSLSVCGCKSIYAAETNNSDQVYEFPDKLIEFHLREQASSVFVLTIYEIPYSNSFRVVKLGADHAFTSWYEDVGFASKALLTGQISVDEEKILKDKLFAISHADVDKNKSGLVVFTITIKLDEGSYYALTCNENNCPNEMCYLFDLIYIVGRQEGALNDEPNPQCLIAE